MRAQFDKQLAELRQELVKLYTDVDLELHSACDALEKRDLEASKTVIAHTRELDQRSGQLENAAYDLIVLQQPVASDLRLLQFIIYVNFNLARMSNHVRNIAKTVRRISTVEVPAQLDDLLASEAHLVYRVLGGAIEAIVESDLSLAASLPELDEPVDDLYKQFYKTLTKLPPKDFEAVSKVIMAARMLERISDNAVETGERLVFLLTGRHRSLDDLADLDEEELTDLYAVRGAGLTLDVDRDMKIVDQIPEIDLDGSGTDTSDQK